jgi:SAM-dependent methyltransferase
MDITRFVSNAVELATAGKVPVYRIRDVANYDFAARGVTSQFLGDAANYYHRYTNPEHFLHLYSIALEKSGILKGDKPARILDIGTGGGNSVFAIRKLLPTAEILGVDISEPLLDMCAKVAAEHYQIESGMAMLCADLYDLQPVRDGVQLVTGSSILHHMLDPESLMLHVLSGLAVGGHAIFTEPMEDGHGIFRGICAGILEDDSHASEPLPTAAKNYMTAYVRDFDARKGVGDVRKYTAALDDKWFFTRAWFAEVAAKAGCASISVIPTHGGRDMFWRQFVVTSKLFREAIEPDAMPQWAKRRFAIFDESFSNRQKAELTFAAVIVIQK